MSNELINYKKEFQNQFFFNQNIPSTFDINNGVIISLKKQQQIN